MDRTRLSRFLSVRPAAAAVVAVLLAALIATVTAPSATASTRPTSGPSTTPAGMICIPGEPPMCYYFTST
jgi:hypothetical protein